jgi:peptide/nickel transport system substrate-binding protein
MKTIRLLPRLVIFILAVILIISTLVISCSSGTTTSPAATTSVATKTTASVAPTSTIKKGGALKIIYGVSPNAFGYGPSMQRSDDILAASPCVETLLQVDTTGATVPWLATDVKANAADNTTIITLRKGVNFQDGTPFNAEAVKWNLEGQMAIKKAELKSVKSIDVIDDYTLRLNQTSFDNGLAFAFTSYPGCMVSPTYFKTMGGEEAVKTHPVGTGPFKFVSFQRDVSLKYTKWDGYWQAGKPYLDTVEFDYIADSMVALASFKAGEGDVILGLQGKDAKELEALGKYTISKTYGALFGLAGDGSHADSPFAKLQVRQAIEYAIEREPVVKAIGLGYWDATDQPCAKTTWGYNTAPSPYTYNPTKAKQLLTEAGYPNGLGLKLTISNSPASAVDLYTAILAQLNQAGFNLTLDVADPARFNEYVIKTGWNNTLLGWNFGEAADASRILTVGFSSFGVPYRSILYPKDTDQVITQIIQATDFNTKKAKTQQAMGLIRDTYASLTTIFRSTSIAAKYKYVKDDGFYTTVTNLQSLQDAWLDK